MFKILGDLVEAPILFRCVVKLILLSNSLFAINVWYTKLLWGMFLMCCKKEIYLQSMVVFKGYLPSSPRTKLLVVDLFMIAIELED